MSRIFISHSTANNAEAIALRDWMAVQGWDDVFLDLDPDRGLKAGERWQEALKRAAERCELVVFVVSPEWAASKWCLAEFLLAKSLNKRIFAAVVVPTPFADLPTEMTAEWQLVDLTVGARDHRATVRLPPGDSTAEVALASDGLNRLRIGLMQAGLDPKHFAWPPADDPNRPPYRGLKPLEAEDASIFFGRDGPIVEALDRLRGLREAPPPRLLVILGASGSGKSSFLRAGLLPRLARDDRHFLPLPPLRPERAAITGETGLVACLSAALAARGLARTRGDIRDAVASGVRTLRPLLQELVARATPPALTGAGTSAPKPPTLILPIDQGEELFLSEGAEEAGQLLTLLRALLLSDAPSLTVLVTIRSDNYERLQMAKPLEGIRQSTLSLPPMPQGAYSEVIRGPARRLAGTRRKLDIEDRLVDRLLADIEAGGAKDALPLLAFTLERLYVEYGGDGDLRLDEYEKLGGITGSIEAAVERAFKAADSDSRIPRDREARLALLRRGLIPWLAGIDPDTGAPRRRVARLSEIPVETRPLIDLLIEQRLLAADVAEDTAETTIEPAHEALLRQWGLLQGWLKQDLALLTVLDGVKRSARDWGANAKGKAWLSHNAERLRPAEQLVTRADLAANLESTDKEYIAACQWKESADRGRRLRIKALVGVLVLGIVAVGTVYWLEAELKKLVFWVRHMRGHAWTDARLAALKPGDTFSECAKTFSEDRPSTKISKLCPDMVVVPAGKFLMGTADLSSGDERPQHEVTMARPFAVSRYAVTFDQWDACVAAGGCDRYSPSDAAWGRGSRPVIYVHWKDAQRYVDWLNNMTGSKGYRLLTEAEWEYAARAGTTTEYYWGDSVGRGNANCDGCRTWYDKKQTAPVDSFEPNAFGLHDMFGNVWQWVQDCYVDSYRDAPMDGSAVPDREDCLRVLRGGSWNDGTRNLRVANRLKGKPIDRGSDLGFRLARTLTR